MAWGFDRASGCPNQLNEPGDCVTTDHLKILVEAKTRMKWFTFHVRHSLANSAVVSRSSMIRFSRMTDHCAP
jgi:hypothetical protein